MNKSIGAFWLNKSKNGTNYMSGNIEINGQPHKLVMFKNGYKDNDKKPDYLIYISEQNNQQNNNGGGGYNNNQQAQNNQQNQQQNNNGGVMSDPWADNNQQNSNEDIPF